MNHTAGMATPGASAIICYIFMKLPIVIGRYLDLLNIFDNKGVRFRFAF